MRSLRCEIRMCCADNELAFDTPVFPVDMSRDEIMADEDCVQLNRRTLARFLTPDHDGTVGHDRKFAVSFKLVKKHDR